jgi:outer membrane protein
MKRLLLFLATSFSVSAQDSISLREAVSIALENNPSISASLANVRAAEARIEQARSGYYPALRYAESYNRSNNPVFAFSSLLLQRRFTEGNFAIDSLNHPGAVQNFQSQLTARQLVYDFGATRHSVDGARLARSAAGEGDRQTRMQVIDGVLRAYYLAVLSAEMQKAAAEAVRSARADLDRAEAIRAAGLSTDADVLSIRVHLAGVEEQHIRRGFDAEIAKAALNEALGLPLDSPHDLTTPLAITAMPAEPLPELETAALQARPEAQQAGLSAGMAESAVGSAKASLLPKVYVQAGLEANRGRFVTQGGGNWLAGAALEWNLFDGNRNRAQIREANEALSEARARQRQIAARLQLEVREAYFRLRSAEERIQVAEAAVAQAGESLRITKDRYENGLSTVTDLIRNETALLDAQTRHHQAIHDQRMAAAGLELATGRLSPDSAVLN